MWKQHRSQCGPLRDTTCHRHPFGHRAVDHYPLAATFQPIPEPPNSPPIKSVFLQFREKDYFSSRIHWDPYCFEWCACSGFILKDFFREGNKTISSGSCDVSYQQRDKNCRHQFIILLCWNCTSDTILKEKK